MSIITLPCIFCMQVLYISYQLLVSECESSPCVQAYARMQHALSIQNACMDYGAHLLGQADRKVAEVQLTCPMRRPHAEMRSEEES